MEYSLPPGIKDINQIDFSNAVQIPCYSPVAGFMIPAKNSTPTLGFKIKKWSQGREGKMNARWRMTRGPDFENRNHMKNRRWRNTPTIVTKKGA